MQNLKQIKTDRALNLLLLLNQKTKFLRAEINKILVAKINSSTLIEKIIESSY